MPQAIDFDGDGDRDLLVAEHDGTVKYFERQADSSFAEFTGSAKRGLFLGGGNYFSGSPRRGTIATSYLMLRAHYHMH